MFKFFVLSNSGSGEARRHFPFRSIIHKHVLPFFFVLVVLLFSSVPVSVHALADPVFQPVYDTQFYQLPQFVDPLNSTQTDIFYFILGSQVVEYAGLSGYEVENPYQDPSSVCDWFKKIGIDLYNDVIESFAIAGAPVIAGAKWIKDLYANIAGAANFAGAFNNSSWSDWFNDVQTNGLSLQLYPSMFGALNQFFAYNDGFFNWQSDMSSFTNTNFSWYYFDPGNFLSTYNDRLVTIPYPHIHINSGASVDCNAIVGSNGLSGYHILFLNSSNGVYNIYNDNHDVLNFNVFNSMYEVSCDQHNGVVDWVDYYTNSNYLTYFQFYHGSINLNNFSSVNDVIQYIFNIDSHVKTEDFIDTVLFGSSIDDSVEVHNNITLNFNQNSNQDTLFPLIDTLLDIKGLIADLLEQNELKSPALDNLTDLNGDPLPAAQLQPVSVAVDLPDSGITVPPSLFGGFFNSSDGFISYLWYMTKPLVVYTHDLLDCFWFGPEGDFDWSGPAPIVFGVISLGLIGGLVVKMLL